MTLKVERDQGVDTSQDPRLTKEIMEAIKHQIMVSVNVELVAYGALPRSERKSRRVFDNRE